MAACRESVINQLPIFKPQHPIGKGRHIILVSDDNHCDPFTIQLGEQLHNLNGGRRIQIACGFIGQKNGRLIGQCPGDGHTLLLTAGEFIGHVLQPLTQAHFFQQHFRPLHASLSRHAAIALSAIRSNKMRSILTMLGIIIGIGSVIAIVSIGDTMRSVIAKEYENVGINRVIFYTMAADGVYTNDDMFTQDDIDQVKDAFGDRVPYIDTYCQDRKTLSNGKRQQEQVYVYAVDAGYDQVQPMELLCGRMIDQGDVEAKRHSLVIEKKIAENYFGTVNALGRTMEIIDNDGREEFTVVGVYKEADSIKNCVRI